MTIRKKLILLLVFPLLVIISFAGAAVYNLYESQQEASQITQLVQLSAISGQLIHEMQKERGMSVGYLGSKGASFKEELKGQRKMVDERVHLFREKVVEVPAQFLSESLKEDLDEVYSELDRIPEFRKEVNELGMPAGAAAAFYTGINKKIIKGVVGYSSLTRDNEITQLITGYSLFLSGKDYAGIERAMLSAAFGADTFTPVVFNKYVNAKASQSEDFNNFTLFASDNSVALFSAFREGEAYAEVEKLRAIADARSNTGGFGIKPTDWFTAKTVKINQLKEIEDAQVEEILTLAGAQMSRTKTLILIWGAGLLCVFGVVIFIGRNMFVSIITPMENLLDAAASIAVGHKEMDPIEEVTDELGGVSFMFHSMMDNISESMEKMEQEKALANEAVQKAGVLQEETRRSEKELKSSVHAMLTALESFAGGDLSMELPDHPNAEINRLYQGYNTALAKVRSLILQLKQVTEQTYRLTARTNQIGSKIANDAHTLSDKSSDVAFTTGSMAESMTDNARLATSTSEMSIESGQAAEKGIQIVEETVHRIQLIADTVNRCVVVIDKLGRSSQEITGIVSVIEDIAEQTNLLALNAAIEAARAGESGRGFAVVAEEVRNLSERTKDSTRQIETVIKALKTDTGNAVEVMQEGQQLVNEGLELADNAHQALQEIGENVQTMVQVVTRIAGSIEGEATRSNQAAGLMKEIDEEAQQTSESVKQIVEALQKLDVLSGELTNTVEIFNVESRSPVDSIVAELTV